MKAKETGEVKEKGQEILTSGKAAGAEHGEGEAGSFGGGKISQEEEDTEGTWYGAQSKDASVDLTESGSQRAGIITGGKIHRRDNLSSTLSKECAKVARKYTHVPLGLRLQMDSRIMEVLTLH